MARKPKYTLKREGGVWFGLVWLKMAWNGMAWNESDEPNLNIVTNNSCRICYVNVNLRRFIHSLYHFLVPNWRTPFSDTFLLFSLLLLLPLRSVRSANAFLEQTEKKNRSREVKSHFFSLFVSRAKPKNLSFNLHTDNGRIIEYAEYFRISAIRLTFMRFGNRAKWLFPRQPNCVRARMCDSSNSRLNNEIEEKRKKLCVIFMPIIVISVM